MRRPSLLAASAALAIAAVVILMAYAGAKHSLSSNLDQVALANLEMSRLGLDSQKTVLSRDDYLPVYGSCELNLRVFDRIDSFFASKPTGFRVEPLAKAGNTDLLIAETCAALGPAIRNKKLAVIISPEWFYRPQVLDVQYAANFSVEHALAALTSPTLGGAIKRRLAKRMADYPRTLDKNPILKQLLLAIEEDGPMATSALRTATLCAAGYQWVLNLSDPLFTWIEFATTRRRFPQANPSLTVSGIDWQMAYSNGEQEFQKMTDGNPLGFKKKVWLRLLNKDQATLRDFQLPNFDIIGKTKEWEDFEIMLEVLKQNGARPLLLAMPVSGKFFTTLGADKQAWSTYYMRLRETAQHYGFPLYDFEEYEDDPRFRGYDDLNPEGWLHLNMVADAFFHDRLSEVSMR